MHGRVVCNIDIATDLRYNDNSKKKLRRNDKVAQSYVRLNSVVLWGRGQLRLDGYKGCLRSLCERVGTDG